MAAFDARQLDDNLTKTAQNMAGPPPLKSTKTALRKKVLDDMKAAHAQDATAQGVFTADIKQIERNVELAETEQQKEWDTWATKVGEFQKGMDDANDAKEVAIKAKTHDGPFEQEVDRPKKRGIEGADGEQNELMLPRKKQKDATESVSATQLAKQGQKRSRSDAEQDMENGTEPPAAKKRKLDLEPDQNLVDNCTCKICFEVQYSSANCVQCVNFHISCLQCFKKCIKKDECPECRTDMSGVERAIRPRWVDWTLGARLVSCSNSGCSVEVKRSLLDNHLTNECLFTDVECSYRDIGCEWKGLRGELEAHACKLDPNTVRQIMADSNQKNHRIIANLNLKHQRSEKALRQGWEYYGESDDAEFYELDDEGRMQFDFPNADFVMGVKITYVVIRDVVNDEYVAEIEFDIHLGKKPPSKWNVLVEVRGELFSFDFVQEMDNESEQYLIFPINNIAWTTADEEWQSSSIKMWTNSHGFQKKS